MQLDVNDNEKVDVEIQLLKRDNFKNRLIYYMSKPIAKQMKRGKKLGKRELQIEIIKRLKEEGMSTEKIRSILRITEEELSSLEKL